MDYSSVGYSEMLGDPVNVGVTLDNQTVLKNREGVRFGSRTMSHQPNTLPCPPFSLSTTIIMAKLSQSDMSHVRPHPAVAHSSMWTPRLRPSTDAD